MTMTVRAALLGAVTLLFACADPAPRPSGPAPPNPAPATPPPTNTAVGVDSFGPDDLGAAATGCTAASDCTAVPVFGGCWAITRSALAGPLVASYRGWAQAGHNRPSGSPASLEAVSDFAAACGPDWAGVECESGRCALQPSDCEFGGMRRTECEAAGGVWGGCVQGRGRIPGCNQVTGDGGKACTDSAQCEGLCIKKFCTKYRRYKGCGVERDGKTVCID